MLRLVSLGRIQRSFRCKPASCGSPSSIRCHGIRAPVWVCADVPHAAPGIMGHRASALTMALSTRGRGAHAAPSGVSTSFRPPRFLNVNGMWTVIVSAS